MGNWRRLLRDPWTVRRSKQSILKEISPEHSLEGLMLKLKLQYFGHLMQRANSLEKTLMLGKDWRQEENRTTEDEMVGWHHWLDGHEFEQVPGVGDGQGGLAHCSPSGHKELDATEWLNWPNWPLTIWLLYFSFITATSHLGLLLIPGSRQYFPKTIKKNQYCFPFLVFSFI